MKRNLVPAGMVDRSGLRKWFIQEYNYCPSWYTISAAIRKGLPCEPHPLLEGRLIFNIEKVRAWMIERRNRKIHPAPLRAAIAP